MDFVKKDWQFRDVISENELNRMEDGIEEGITKAEQAKQTAESHASRHLEGGADPIPYATVTDGGLMSAEDKQKLTELEELPGEVDDLREDLSSLQGDFTRLESDTVKKSGDTMTGDLVLGNPIAGHRIIRRRGVDEQSAIYFEFEDLPTANALISLFRFTNTTGSKTFAINRGDGTNSPAFVVLNGRITTLNEMDVHVTAGTNSPEGSVSAPQGSLYLRTNGELWLKESGTGNTGWKEVQTV